MVSYSLSNLSVSLLAMTKSTLKTHDEKRKAMMAMMKRRLALKQTKDQNGGGGGGGISNSHGASWVRGSFLGRRGFGLVFLAKSRKPINDDDSESPSEMAVKSAYMDKASSLKTEKEVICTLRASPFVVKCYGDEITLTDDGKKVYNILLESGCSLKDYIEKSKTGLPESEVKLYARDILRGLQYVHCRGYIHCDINPSNILLVPGSSSRSGGLVAKIADFGLVKSMYSDENETVKPRDAKSFAYMAPEVLARYNPLEAPADIWAVGCVVVEMMSGSEKQLWGVSEVDNELLKRIAYSPELPEFPSNISEHGRDFLAQCLNKCHEDRWSAESLAGHPFLLEPRR